MVELGLAPGPRVGEVLRRAREAQALGAITNPGRGPRLAQQLPAPGVTRLSDRGNPDEPPWPSSASLSATACYDSRRRDPTSHGVRAEWRALDPPATTAGYTGRRDETDRESTPASAESRREPPPHRMRLLVTNPWNGQAYCVLRSLRRHATRVVATVYGSTERWDDSRRPRCRASWIVSIRCPSRFRTGGAAVSTRRTPPPKRPTSRPSLDICERESLDTVFPSWDPEVLVLSKNKDRLARRGVTVPVPDVVRAPQGHGQARPDRAASELGFACPRTYLPGAPEDAAELGKRLGYPLVVKPRFSVRGRGSSLVTDPAKLEETVRRVLPTFGMPMLQEWIPGGLDQRVSVAVTLDRAGRPSPCTRAGTCGRS